MLFQSSFKDGMNFSRESNFILVRCILFFFTKIEILRSFRKKYRPFVGNIDLFEKSFK